MVISRLIPIVIILWFLIFHSCGENIFSSFDQDTTSEGDSALNSGDFDAAIVAYEAALDDPSLSASERKEIQEKLASAYMGRTGIDIIDIIENASGGDGGDSEFDLIMNITPDATVSNLSDINKAVELLTSIKDPTPAQSFQTGLAQTTQAFLSIKSFVEVAEEGEMVDIDAENSVAIVESLAGAADSLATAGDFDEEGYGDQITTINQEIDTHSGGLQGYVNEALGNDNSN